MRNPARAWAISLATMGVLAALWATAARGQTIIDPGILEKIRDSVCFSETFDAADANAFGGRLVDGMVGKALSTKGAKTGAAFPAERTMNPAAGTISWWARYDVAAIKSVPVFTLNVRGGTVLYVNFFGKEGSSDPRHSNRLGHYYNRLGAAVFAAYPEGIPKGKWMHFAFAWNGNVTRFYVNGLPSSTQTTPKPFSALKFDAFTLGGAGEYVFDEVRVYNRELTREELRAYAAAVRMGGPVAKMALAVPEKLARRVQAALRVAYRLSDHAVQVYADLSGGANAGPMGVKVVVRDGAGAALSGRSFTLADPTALFYASIPMGKPLPDGTYHVELSAGGKTCQATFDRVKEVWEENRIGVTDKVISPWTPMSVQGDKINCWGRQYAFGAMGLPRQIVSTQPEPTRGPSVRDLLAGPVRIVAETAAGPLAWSGPAPSIRQRSGGYVDVAATATTAGKKLSASVTGTLEFDGLYKFTVRISPAAAADEAPLRLTSVRLEVPLPDDIACLFNASKEGMRTRKTFLDIEGLAGGLLWDSINAITVNGEGGTQNRVKATRTPPVWPHVWLGDDDRGIAVMTDSDRGWSIDPKLPCMDLVRAGGRTVLRLHLLNRPTSDPARPITATLSLQATPIKPRPAGGSWKAAPSFGWSHFDGAAIEATSFDLYDKGQIPRRGPRFNTPQEASARRWWKYGCLQTHRVNLEDPVYGAMVRRTADEWQGGLLVPSLRDFLLWSYKQWHDRAGLAGMYYDNTYARPTNALGSGLAWRDEQGGVRPGYNVFGQREFLKRMRTYFTSVGPAPVMMTHITDAPIIGTLGFADFWLDGENGGYPTAEQSAASKASKTPLDFVDRWYNKTGMINLRITLGRQWGTMPVYLYSWGLEATQAVLGQFDLNNQPNIRYGLGARYTALNKMDYPFGLDQEDCLFIPYWHLRKVAQVVQGGPDVLAATWKRPGRARLLVSNCSDEDRRVSVKLGAGFLGLPPNAVGVDEQTGEPVTYKRAVVGPLAVDRHSYRIVLLAAPGKFPPAPSREASLLPAKRIAALCDDLTGLKDPWKVLPENKPVRVQWEMLRLDECPHVIVRPFNEDLCSVQVKVRAMNGWWKGGPSMYLLWGKDKYVRILAGHENPMPHGVFVRAWAAGGPAGKTAHFQGPRTGTATWIKVTLGADTISFSASTDGKTWESFGQVPRKGFEGAPAQLVLGNAHGDGQSLFTNTGRARGSASFFSDLITARAEADSQPAPASQPARGLGK